MLIVQWDHLLVNRLGGKIETFIMDEVESLEIDTDLDFKIVETILGSFQ